MILKAISRPVLSRCGAATRCALGLVLFGLIASPASAAPLEANAFTYQGRLTARGLPVNGHFDLRLMLFDRLETNQANQIGPTLTNVSELVTNGLFTTTLDFGPGIFTGSPYFLEVAVRPSNLVGAGFGDPLLPRQRITPAPYALYAANAGSVQLAGTYGGVLNFSNPANTISGNGAGLTNLNAINITSGVLSAARIDPQVARLTNVWRLGGNSGTMPGQNFVGTTDTNALEFKVNGARSLRLQPGLNVPSLVGGYSGNYVSPAADGATIGGGGGLDLTNAVTADFGSIAGGRDNTVSAPFAAIGGGSRNLAAGQYATVAGGSNNVASGNYSFAAGRRAKANHPGAFVWADSLDADAMSTAPDQFTVRAGNGVRLTANGENKAIGVGQYYRDNAVIAWGRVNSPGLLQADFGVESVTNSLVGTYDITLDASAASNFQLVPIAIAEMDSAPTNAATARLVTVNQTGTRMFTVYVTNGNYAATNNTFLFMVTGR